METYAISLGQVVMALSRRGTVDIDPSSRTAARLAAALERTLSERIRRAMLSGELPAYPIRCTVERIEKGSLLVYLDLIVDITNVVAGAVVGAGFFTFLKDYDSLRKGVAKLAADINFVSVTVFGFLRRQFDVKPQDIRLKESAQIDREVAAGQQQVQRELEARSAAIEAKRDAAAARAAAYSDGQRAGRSRPADPA